MTLPYTDEVCAARISVLHAIAARVDTLTTSIDPACRPQAPCEHVTGLAVSLGDPGALSSRRAGGRAG